MQTPRFINTELKSDSESDSEPDSEVESKSDAELMAKLKSGSNSESIILLTLGKSKKNSHFADFGQVKKQVFLPTLGNKVILLLVVGLIKPFWFMSIFWRKLFFSQALFQTYF